MSPTVARAATLVVLVGVSLALSAPLALKGTVRSGSALPAGMRVGVFALARAGQPAAELASAPVAAGGHFAIALPEAAPPEATRVELGPDGLADWPGLLGRPVLAGDTRAAQAGLRAYTDANGSGRFDEGDTLWSTAISRDKPGGMVLVWANGRLRVSGERGFDLTLEPGWNLVVVEAGRVVKATREAAVDGLRLDVFRR